jgi:nitric oxide reductase large subunit
LSPPWFWRIGVALYFSVVSAFNIGWEEINIGSWIARMQPKEITLKATGWVRVVAGVQSLLGVYMVALSILSYFGHLFE